MLEPWRDFEIFKTSISPISLCLTFLNHQEKQDTESSDKSREDSSKFEFQRARHEVRLLGIRGFENKEKRKALTAYMVELGAKVNLLLISSTDPKGRLK